MKKIIAILIIFIATGIFAATAMAKQASGNTKPGWGNGDKNHEHVGPPGRSVHP